MLLRLSSTPRHCAEGFKDGDPAKQCDDAEKDIMRVRHQNRLWTAIAMFVISFCGEIICVYLCELEKT